MVPISMAGTEELGCKGCLSCPNSKFLSHKTDKGQLACQTYEHSWLHRPTSHTKWSKNPIRPCSPTKTVELLSKKRWHTPLPVPKWLAVQGPKRKWNSFKRHIQGGLKSNNPYINLFTIILCSLDVRQSYYPVNGILTLAKHLAFIRKHSGCVHSICTNGNCSHSCRTGGLFKQLLLQKLCLVCLVIKLRTLLLRQLGSLRSLLWYLSMHHEIVCYNHGQTFSLCTVTHNVALRKPETGIRKETLLWYFGEATSMPFLNINLILPKRIIIQSETIQTEYKSKNVN